MGAILISIVCALFGAFGGSTVWFWRTVYLCDRLYFTALQPIARIDPLQVYRRTQSIQALQIYLDVMMYEVRSARGRSILCAQVGGLGLLSSLFPLIYINRPLGTVVFTAWLVGFVLASIWSVVRYHRHDWRGIKEQTEFLKLQLPELEGRN